MLAMKSQNVLSHQQVEALAELGGIYHPVQVCCYPKTIGPGPRD